MKSIKTEKVLNKQRRRVMQGVGATVAVAACPPVFAAGSVIGNSQAEGARITGTIVSKLNDPVKALVIKNHSDHVATINSFDNARLMFDSEIVDCNSACIDQPLSLEAGEEKLIQFDFRKKTSTPLNNPAWLNVQSTVTRLNEGTRVVPIAGTISNGIANI